LVHDSLTHWFIESLKKWANESNFPLRALALFPLGYLFSILIETPILLIGLSPRHPLRRRVFAGVWLTACTYQSWCW